MKKNLLPLLAIAFVIALIATAAFYGLVVTRMSAKVSEMPAGQPVKKVMPDVGVPAGMRAISVQVGDSSGVLKLLQPGHRVDVQTVYTRDSSQEMQLRTILENVPVLEVDLAPDKAPGKPTLPVVTLLTSPGDADTLALADSAAHVRLLLRNAGDKAVVNRSSLAFGAVLRGGTPAPSRAVRKSSAPLVPVAPAPACEPKTPLSPATPTVQ